MDIKELYSIFVKCGSVATDSRAIRGGELFFALKGENFDGNEYAVKALEAGAAYAVVNADAPVAGKADCYPSENGGSRIIKADDTLAQLQALARYHRENVLGEGNHLTVIGITGTNGKTTTKELLRTVLSAGLRTVATEGNLNNDIGVPLSLLKITPDTQIAIIEMGASHPDDITKLVKVSEPDYGIITNVGKAHLLGFGSFEGVKKAKGRLYDYVNEFGKAVFVNQDDEVLRSMCAEREGLSIVPYGLNTDGCAILETTSESPFLRIKLSDGKVINTSLIGNYNSANVLAALCVGKFFGISEDKALAAIASYRPSNSRSQMVRTERNSLIVDAYNANPSSMRAALMNFFSINASPKAVLLGDMRELGDGSVNEHKEILKLLAGAGIDHIYLVGEEFRKALEDSAKPANVNWFATSVELADELARNPLSGYTALVKGSRGIQMEKTIPSL